MTRPLLLSSFAALAALMAAAVALLILVPAGAQGSELPNRATLPMLASDSVEPGVGGLEPVVPAFCETVPDGQNPPRFAMFGLVTVSGTAAADATPVQIYLDGKAGPVVLTTRELTENGYRTGYIFEFYPGGPACSNRIGAVISFRVNGVEIQTGRSVQDAAIRHDIAVP